MPWKTCSEAGRMLQRDYIEPNTSEVRNPWRIKEQQCSLSRKEDTHGLGWEKGGGIEEHRKEGWIGESG